ncbi:MAG: ferredoxin [Trebouxia sp. A1-2]|nr:MAG: ferredoxin [Trebouxia sp. A1-2]
MCKDVVNTRKNPASSMEGQATIVFAGVEGQEISIADLSFTLEEDEVEQGLTLICMSRPVSDVVKIETQSDWGYSLGTSDWKGATGHIAGKEVQPLSKS